MAKPKNKSELLQASKENFIKLLATIESLDENIQTKDFNNDGLNKNIRDVICHLLHWQLMFFEWYSLGMKGQNIDMPLKGYKWNELPQLNKIINEKYQQTTLTQGLKILNKSNKRVVKLIDKHSNDQLFTKKIYGWTGSTSLGAYLISCTSSHYDWALKVIKKGIKQ